MDNKRLFILRHAKSSWDDPALADHERPLAKRGRKASRLISEHLREKRIEPALVLCSSARRGRETLKGIAAAIADEGDVRIEDRIYGATAGELLAHLHEIPDQIGSVMLIGHNPAMQDLCRMLVGDDSEAEAIIGKFPTAALATLEIAGGWGELGPGDATLAAFVKPRELAREHP